MSSSIPKDKDPVIGGAKEDERLLVEQATTDPLAFGRPPHVVIDR